MPNKLTTTKGGAVVLSKSGSLITQALAALWEERAEIKERAKEVDDKIAQLTTLAQPKVEAQKSTLQPQPQTPKPAHARTVRIRMHWKKHKRYRTECKNCGKRFLGIKGQQFHNKRCGDIWYNEHFRQKGLKVGYAKRNTGGSSVTVTAVKDALAAKIPGRYTRFCGNPECPKSREPGYPAFGPAQRACSTRCQDRMKELGIEKGPTTQAMVREISEAKSKLKAETLVAGDPLRAGS